MLHAKILRIFQLPIALVGNDIKGNERRVSTAEAQALANKLGCAFFEASLKGRVNVEEPITELVRKVRKQSPQLWPSHHQLSCYPSLSQRLRVAQARV